MENERPTRLMTFRPAWNRILHSPGFWINVISVMLFSFISPYILEFLIQNLGRLPVEIIEALRQGSGYNIGLFTVSSLENIDLAYCDGIICGVFSEAPHNVCSCLFLSDSWRVNFRMDI